MNEQQNSPGVDSLIGQDHNYSVSDMTKEPENMATKNNG